MLYVIPGFLGKREDWDLLKVPFCYLDLMSDSDWGESLPECAEKIALQIANDNEASILGYSLGGRVALHLITQHKSLIKRAVIISSHPGLLPDERPLRIDADTKWASRFLSDSWAEVMNDWNSQAVFKGHVLERREEDYSRRYLSKILINWSLGRQEDLRGEFIDTPSAVTWITGERDQKFTALAKECVGLFPEAKHLICRDAGHRVPWDNTSKFLEIVESILS